MSKYYFNLTGKAFKPEPAGDKDSRPAKEDEIQTAKDRRKQIDSLEKKIHKLKLELEDLKKECPHLVFWDEGGFMYDTRHCVGCGATDLI